MREIVVFVCAVAVVGEVVEAVPTSVERIFEGQPTIITVEPEPVDTTAEVLP